MISEIPFPLESTWLKAIACMRFRKLCVLALTQGVRIEADRILKKRAQGAGIQSCSPHDLRRTFCSDLLDAGVDIVTAGEKILNVKLSAI